MRNRHAIVIATLMAALAAAVPLFAQALPPAGTILEDQFGNAVDAAALFSLGRAVVVASDARESAEVLSAWKAALAGLLPTDVRLWLVADLRGLPFFVPRSAVINQLKRDWPGMPILLDWKGVVSSVLAIGRDGASAEAWTGGKRLARATGPADAGKARTLAAAFR